MVAKAARWPALRIRPISSNRSMARPASGYGVRRVLSNRTAGHGWTAPPLLTTIARRRGGAMKALVVEQRGGPEVLEDREAADPQPGHGEVLVRVGACALNHLD